MQFSLTSLALFALGASAATVNKRAGEGVHLANCYQSSPLGDIAFSSMIYYDDDSKASQNTVPSNNDRCYVTIPGQGGWKNWEGGSVSCTFPTNTYFNAGIQSGAGGYGVGQYAGWGQNNYRGFNCYRDNNHQLFNDGTFTCYSIYYCLNA